MDYENKEHIKEVNSSDINETNTAFDSSLKEEHIINDINENYSDIAAIIESYFEVETPNTKVKAEEIVTEVKEEVEPIKEEPIIIEAPKKEEEIINDIDEDYEIIAKIIEEATTELNGAVEPVVEETKEVPKQEVKQEEEKVEEAVNEEVSIKEDINKIISSIEPEKKEKKKKDKKEEESTLIDPKEKKRQKTINVLAYIVSIIVILGILGFIGCLVFANYLLEGKPEFDENKLRANDSTIIYDADGNEIVELGLYLRENIEYEDMPTCLIDAFVSIEDSRYFEHIGFDIPRFTKAALSNVMSGSFGQGGSTMTMQLVKNSYFQVDADGDSTMAATSGLAGVKRKMQEIVLSIETSNKIDKKEVIALYINKINFGNNIRGVEKAAEYYFGKSAKDLNLVESCFLAGIINAPNLYNPYNELYKNNDNYIYLNPDITYLENAQERTAEVIDLMAYHGYISEEEAALAKTVKIEDLLSGVDDKFQSYSNYYQDYIDAVISEAEDVTGKDPYTTPMKIYTNMDTHMQKLVYDIENENTELKYTRDLEQSAIVVLNNQTGELVALGGGRNQNQEVRQFNRATSAFVQPGSVMKPILEYVLAFDKLGWSTAHTITDQPYYLYGSDLLISNAGDQGYTGDMLITEAIARSLNTPAIQTLDAVIEEIDEDGVVDYLKSIGFTANLNSFDLQWAIGGNTCVCTPVQLTAAHAMLINEGYYVSPHTISRIDFQNGDEDYVADTEGTQVVSSAAAYMAAKCEENNVSGEFYNLMQILRRDYPVYAKTGTTDWGSSGKSYGIPTGAPKDMWMVAQTSNYSVTVWLGFDKAEKGAFFTSSEDMANLKGKMCKKILDELEDHFDYNPHDIEMPEDCTQVTFVKGAYPYAASDGAHETVTGYIKKSALEETPLTSVEDVLNNLTDKENIYGVTLSGSVNEYGEANIEIKSGGYWCYDGVQNITAINYSGDSTSATGRCYFPHYRNTETTSASAHITVTVNDVYFGETDGDGYAYMTGLPESGTVKACTSEGACATLNRY